MGIENEVGELMGTKTYAMNSFQNTAVYNQRGSMKTKLFMLCHVRNVNISFARRKFFYSLCCHDKMKQVTKGASEQEGDDLVVSNTRISFKNEVAAHGVTLFISRF